MLERYTENARRAIFFAHYEASQFGSVYIEPEHLLLGVVREDRAFTLRFLASSARSEIRSKIEEHTAPRERKSSSADLPLSSGTKRVLAFAAEEAETLHHRHVGCEHLFLGLMREQNSFAAELIARFGVRLEQVRDALRTDPVSESARAGLEPEDFAEISTEQEVCCFCGELLGGVDRGAGVLTFRSTVRRSHAVAQMYCHSPCLQHRLIPEFAILVGEPPAGAAGEQP